MADDVINIAAEAGRNIIDDDAEPAITFTSTNATGTGAKIENTSTGVGLDVESTTGIAIDVDSTSGTGIDVLTAGTAGVLKSSASEGVVLNLAHSVIASPTVAPLLITSSAASGALMEFNTGLVSSASYTVNTVLLPVLHTAEDKIVYLAGYEMV